MAMMKPADFVIKYKTDLQSLYLRFLLAVGSLKIHLIISTGRVTVISVPTSSLLSSLMLPL